MEAADVLLLLCSLCAHGVSITQDMDKLKNLI